MNASHLTKLHIGKWTALTVLLMVCRFAPASASKPDEFTRGAGIYPGDPKEDFSPAMRIDATYRNLAFRRPAFHSSAWDFNLTAQLVTDGVIDTTMPDRFSVSTSQNGELKRNERGHLFDRHFMTTVTMDGPKSWIEIDLSCMKSQPSVDSIGMFLMLRMNEQVTTGWSFALLGSDDGKTWRDLRRSAGVDTPGVAGPRWWARRFMIQSFRLDRPSHSKYYRMEFEAPGVASCSLGGLDLFNDGKPVQIGGPYEFISAWAAGSDREEWVSVDLGAICGFDRIALYWIRRPGAGSIQASDDGLNWKDIQAPLQGKGRLDEIRLEKYVKGRYVRVLTAGTDSSEGCILSELEVFGRGGPVAVPHPAPDVKKDGRLDLAGGGWRVERASRVDAGGEELSRTDYRDDGWIVATVPGTILTSWLNAGALPDPDFSDNQLMISESFFQSDFWYRNEFAAPASYEGKRVFINFDGINWKARVFLNGKDLGRIEGGFIWGKFDVTDILVPGKPNVLAVLIEKNATPGYAKEKTFESPDANGGELGADNPTYHASIGWDWIPTIRGRNTGIWNDVFLTAGGPVTIGNPFVTADLPLPDTTRADVTLEVTLQNHGTSPVTGILCGSFGKTPFEKTLTLGPLETKTLRLNPASHPALRLKNPKLWWPAGYGRPDLYPVGLEFVTADGLISDEKSFQTGIREMAYDESNGILKIWINGRRFIGRGGNWGFPESMLRYRGREYDAAVRYHADMNFTLIRNWVGQTGDDEFFEACDRHGVMVWQDFWLANPVDGPNPNDNGMFLRNAGDLILRIRNHPSIALYCGRNEGNPPDTIDQGLRKLTAGLHPGSHYISNSAWGVVSGGGPYRMMPVKHYFEERATTKLHSEMGMPNIVSFESLRDMLPDSALWPQGRLWGVHDFCLNGAQGGTSFREWIDKSFGPVDNARDWVGLAQWANYEGYRAMFEAQSKNRMGLLLWMSHPAWPSLVWQTYDYDLEPTAAYFACKKASEPLHIQWNRLTDSVEVVNYSFRDGSGLRADAEILNLDGSVGWSKTIPLDCDEDQTVSCMKIENPAGLSNVHFIRLKLMKNGEVLSENIYWRGVEEGNLKALRDLPRVKLEVKTRSERQSDLWYLTTVLTNPSKHPALMIKLSVVREKSRDRILPVIFSDNYVFLMPGEKREIRMELENADTCGEKPVVVIDGFNVTVP